MNCCSECTWTVVVWVNILIFTCATEMLIWALMRIWFYFIHFLLYFTLFIRFYLLRMNVIFLILFLHCHNVHYFLLGIQHIHTNLSINLCNKYLFNQYPNGIFGEINTRLNGRYTYCNTSSMTIRPRAGVSYGRPGWLPRAPARKGRQTENYLYLIYLLIRIYNLYNLKYFLSNGVLIEDTSAIVSYL